ncbi:pilus assembly PilX family protein [Undibacterium sp. RuRC25W]|uniref:pilus assembly PilX family protein n=1 Tax=Undibacterium sp. RuRC25W TaxID=3413047 RepID=UPI003BF32E7C
MNTTLIFSETISRISVGRQFSRHKGIALVTALLILVVLTLIGLTMFRGFGLQQKIAGNTREKERAYQAAQNALEYGEWWLVNGTQGTSRPGSGTTCASAQSTAINAQSSMLVCSNALATPSDPTSWPAMLSYTPPPMIVSAGGGSTTDAFNNTDINYNQAPGIYINFQNRVIDSRGNTTNVYTVTAVGFGGSKNSTSVVQSVYSVTVGGKITPLSSDPINN